MEIEFILIILAGIIIGILISILTLIVIRKNETRVERALNHKVFQESVGKAFIAGLSDEEQTFRDNLLDKE